MEYTYIPHHKNLSGRPDPNHDRRENAFALLEEGLGHLGDAWCCLHEAMKQSVYFEPDEVDIEEITDSLIKLESKLEKILKKYRS